MTTQAFVKVYADFGEDEQEKKRVLGILEKQYDCTLKKDEDNVFDLEIFEEIGRDFLESLATNISNLFDTSKVSEGYIDVYEHVESITLNE